MSENRIEIVLSARIDSAFVTTVQNISKTINDNLIKAVQGYNLPSAKNSAFVEYFKEVDKQLKIQFAHTQKTIDNFFNSSLSKAGNTALPSAKNSALVNYYKDIDKNLKIQFNSTQKTIDDMFKRATSKGGNTPLPTASTSMFSTLPWQEVKKIDESFKNLSNSGGGISNTIALLSSMGSVVTGIWAGVQLVRQAWDSVAGTVKKAWDIVAIGLRYEDIIENSRLGMAGLLFQMTDLVKNQQILTDATEKWSGALQISDRLTAQLQNAALKTRAIYSELARGMQEGFGPMLQAGVVEGQVTPFVTRFIHLMSTLRVPLREIGQEMRAFFNLESNPRTARVSFAFLGQMAKEWGMSLKDVKERLKEIKTEGGLDELFMSMTKGAEIAGLASMKTLSGYVSNLKEAFEALVAEGTGELYKTLTESADKLLDSLIQIDAQGKRTFNKELVSAISDVAGAFAKVAQSVVDIVIEMTKEGGLISTTKDFFKLMKESNTFEQGGFLTDLNEAVISYADELHKKHVKPVVDPIIRMNDWILNKRGIDRWGVPLENPTPLDYTYERVKGGSNSALYRQAMIEYENSKKFYGPESPFYGPPVPDTITYDPGKGGGEENEEAIKEFWRNELDRRKRLTDLTNRWADELEKSWNEGIKQSEKRLTDWLGGWSEKSSLEMLKPRHDEEFEKFKSQYPNLFGDLEQNWSNAASLAGKQFLTEINKEWSLEAFKRKAETFNENAAKFWSGPMTNIFAELGTTGGRNFLQVMAGNFDQMVSDAAVNFVDILSKAFGLGEITVDKDEQGNPIFFRNGKFLEGGEEQFLQLQRRQQNINAAMGLASLGFGSYAAGRQNAPGSITGGAVGGAMTGLSIGGATPFGAILGALGAVVGGLAAALGKADARDQYKYAIPVISATGDARLTQVNKNIQTPEQKEILAKLQDQFDKFWNGYVQLVVKFTSGVVPKLTEIFGKFQKEASGNFLKHLDEFINGTLPDLVSGMFKGVLSAGAQALGMTGARFNELFAKFDKLDPSKTLELLNILFETLTNINKISTSRPAGVDLGGPGPISAFNLMVGQEAAAKPLWHLFRETDKEIVKLSSSLSSLTGEAQIRAAHELSNLVLDRMEKERQLAKEIANFLQDSSRQFASLRQQYTLEMMGEFVTDKEGNKTWEPDFQKQIDYLQDYMQTIMSRIQTSTNTEQIAFWQNEFFKTSQQLGGIYQNMGPENYQNFLKWMMGENGQGGILSQFESAISGRMSQIGELIGAEWDILFKKIQPVFDEFLGKTKDVTTGIDELIPPILELIPPIRDVRLGLTGLAEDIQFLRSTIGQSGFDDGGQDVGSDNYSSQIIMNRLANA